jgi:benzoate membrane transport protein
MQLLFDIKRDFSISALVAGIVVVLIGYTSTGAVVFAACKALGGTQADLSSWMWALGWGMGLSCLLPALRYRLPIVAAWSTPGAALIASSPGTLTMSEAVAAFLLSGPLIFVSGATGWFERVMSRVPMAIASALLAGILFRFGLNVFTSFTAAPWLVLAMLSAHLMGRRLWSRYSVVGVLLAGALVVAAQGTFQSSTLALELAQPKWTQPTLSWNAVINLAIPLFLVTMLSQNMPGVAVMRACGVAAPISEVIATTGVTTTVFAPFGGFAINLAAITAAIAMSRESHADPKRRYVAAVVTGVFYCIAGTFGAVIAGLFAAFPAAFIATLAGLALLGTLGNSLASALADEGEREAALITFLIAASGLTVLGVGAAFWAIVVGLVASAALQART